ncbi:hypothetical protein [Echinicola salinicaeni]|uniref:hypothetical protein n=1 Tax=Echinicola salinicaeni TaxID=2762757 RepID=UPI00164504AB|nr:hypothetical protein [Echinicola salinicaeni]
MTKAEVEDYIKSNTEDKIHFYLDHLISKSNDLAKETNRLGIMIIVLLLLFYLIEGTYVESINVGPIHIKDITSIQIFVPLVLAFLILRNQIVSTHKSEIVRILKVFSRTYFNYENKNLGYTSPDDFTRTLMPISIYSELYKVDAKRNNFVGKTSAIVMGLLALIVNLTPFVFEIIWLKELFSNFDNYDFVGNSVIIITVWILVISVYYFFNDVISTSKEVYSS